MDSQKVTAPAHGSRTRRRAPSRGPSTPPNKTASSNQLILSRVAKISSVASTAHDNLPYFSAFRRLRKPLVHSTALFRTATVAS